MSEAMLWATKLSLAGTVFEFVKAGVKQTAELLLDDEGLRGTRSMSLERATQGLLKIGGPISLNPTPLELKTIWPYCVQNSTGDTLTDAMQDCAVIMDLQTAAYSFTGRMNKIKLAGQPGKKLDVDLDYLGYALTIGSGGTVSGTPDITNRPYMMTDMGSGVIIGGMTYLIDQFSLEIDNKIDPTFMQGQTATDLMPTGREVTLSVRLKYTSTEAGLLTTAMAGPALGSPVTATLAFTNGSNSVTFAFPALIAKNPDTVTATDKKLRLPLNFACLRVGASLEVVTTFV